MEAAPTPPPPPRPSRLTRVLRVLAIVAAVLVLLLLAAVVAGRAWLSSEAGGAYVLEQLRTVATSTIAGRLEVGRVEVSGLLRIVLVDVKLFAPDDTAPAATIERVELVIDAPAAAQRRVVVPELSVTKPVLTLVEDARGWNLARALETKPSPPAGPVEAALPWTLVLPDIRLVGGVVDVTRPDAAYRADGLAFTMAVEGPLDRLDLRGRFTVDARAPIDLPFALDLDATLVSKSQLVIRTFDARGGTSALSVRGEAAFAPPRADLTLARFVLAAADARSVAGLELLGDVTGAGTLRGGLTGGHADLALALPSGRMTMTLDATLGLPGDDGQSLDWKAAFTVDEVRTARVLASLPDATLQLKGDAAGRGVWPDGTLQATVEAAGSRLEALALERGSLQVVSDGPRLKVDQTRFAAAGATISLSGSVTRTEGRLLARLQVPKLDRTRRRLLDGLPKLLGGRLPELAGTLDADVSVNGPFARPKLSAAVRAPALRYATTTLAGLTGDVVLERWTAPYRGHAGGRVDRIDSGSVHARALRFNADLDEDGLGIDFDGQVNDRPVRAAAHGEREAIKGGERWKVRAIEGSAFGLNLRTTSATVVTYARGRLDVAPPLRLDGTLGTLTLAAGGVLEGDFKARGTFDGIDLAKLPTELVALPGGTRGVLSGEATLTGPVSTPGVTASLTISDGGYGGFGPVSGKTEVSYMDGRVRTSGDLSIPAGASVTFAGSAETTAFRDRTQPVEATLVAKNVDLASLAPLAASLGDTRGTVSATAVLGGSLASPTLKLSASAGALAGRGYGPFDAATTVGYRDDALVVDAQFRGGEILVASVDASTRLPSATLLDGDLPPWRTLTVDGKVTISQALLARLPELGIPNGGLAGTANGAFTLGDTLGGPKLSGTVGITSLASGALTPVDVALTLLVSERISFGAKVARRGKPLLDADVKLLAATATLVDGKAEVASLPLDVRVTLLPVRLSELQREPGNTDALLSGRMTLTGSLDAPTFNSTYEASAVTIGRRSAGDYRFSVNHAGGFTKVLGHDEPKRGKLDLDVSLKGDLGLSQLQKRVEERRARDGEEAGYADVLRDGELAGHLILDKFDLGLFDGLDADFRDVGGLLSSRFHVRGTGHDPVLDGDLEITGGRVAPYEYGVLSDVTLLARLDWPRLALTRLDGRGLQGRFSSKGELVLSDLSTPAVRGTFDLRTDGMPLVKAYQTRAWLSMTLASRFELLGKLIEADIDISRGQLRVPEVLPRRVQDLEPHPDVVFVSGGRVLGRSVRKWDAKARIKIADDFNVLAPSDTNIFLGADLVFATRRTPGRTGSMFDLTGPVRLPRGQLAFLGRRFELDSKSRLQFQPGAWDDPQLAVRARFEGRDGVEVTVDVGGTPEALETTLTSNPSMEQAEIVYYLTTGQRQLKAQASTATIGAAITDSAFSAAGSVVAGVFKSAVEKFVPVDVLTVEADTAQLGGRLKAGKYINERLYIGGQYNPAALPAPGSNLFEVELEYRLADELSGHVRFGDSGRAGGEILFQREFWAPEQKKKAK